MKINLNKFIYPNSKICKKTGHMWIVINSNTKEMSNSNVLQTTFKCKNCGLIQIENTFYAK